MEIKLRDFKLRFRRIFGAIDERFEELIFLSAGEIMANTLSLEHIECDKSSFEIFKELDGQYFLRPYNIQKSEDDLIDFKDHNLISALMYKCAMHLSTEGLKEYESMYFKNLNAYSFRIRSEGDHSIKEILEANKYAIPYVYKENNTKSVYKWDKEFLDNLDYYLADERANNAYRYRRFVWWFKAYQDGDENARNDIKALDILMSEKLKGALNGNS